MSWLSTRQRKRWVCWRKERWRYSYHAPSNRKYDGGTEKKSLNYTWNHVWRLGWINKVKGLLNESELPKIFLQSCKSSLWNI